LAEVKKYYELVMTKIIERLPKAERKRWLDLKIN
jgi:hypothetical protein